MTKNLADMPKGTRRIQTSRLIGSVKEDSANNDTWLPRHFVYETDIDHFGKIDDLTRKYVVTYDDFEESKVYPLDNSQY
jgi:hypothetical protein